MRGRMVAAAILALVAALGLATVTAQGADVDAEVRVTAQRLADGRTEFALQQREVDGAWSERVLPRARFFPATAGVGRWLSSTPLTVRAPGADADSAGIEVRITAQRLASGGIEFALQQREDDGDWSERLLPRARFFPVSPRVGRWLSSTPLTVLVPGPDTDRGSPESDRAALAAFYEATGGATWVDSTNWLSGGPLGEWFGVTTEEDGRVARLYLRRNGLSGPIPPDIGDLANLELLDLRGNELSGQIPPELGDLPNLEALYLSDNDLSGPIPPDLGDLPNLQFLGLSSNHLTGSIPADLGNLANVHSLSLGLNQLTGSIPPELGAMANLETLYLAGSDLSGPIPPELGDLVNLQVLYLAGNDLSGPIPPNLGDLANLGLLGLEENNLSGPIPPGLGDLTSLGWLNLSANQLTGSIPPELGNLTSLHALHLDRNRLSGSIPPELGDLTSLSPDPPIEA